MSAASVLSLLCLLATGAVAARRTSDAAAAILQQRSEGGDAVVTSKLDRATSGKESDGDEEDRTACVCLLEEVKIERWGHDEKLKFTDLSEAGKFSDKEDCAQKCPSACQAKLDFKFAPDEAKMLG